MGVIAQKLYGSNTSSADAVASVDIQEDGVVEGILCAHAFAGDAAAEGGVWEVSFASVSAFTSNDTRASLATFVGLGNAIGGGSENTYVPTEIPVAAGERLYIHTAVIGTPTSNAVRITLYVRQKGDPARSRARFR